jgi:hypothetical protein
MVGVIMIGTAFMLVCVFLVIYFKIEERKETEK